MRSLEGWRLVAKDLSRIRGEMAVATQSCLDAVSAARSASNPYSQAILRDRAASSQASGRASAALKKTIVPPDEIEGAVPLEKSPRVEFPADLYDPAKNAAELAGDESK